MTDILSTPKTTSRKPYIYKVTNFETGQYYIGSQCSGKKIGINYFTSSTNKAFREGFKTYGEEKYKITIIKEFIDPDECVRVENYIIRNYMLKKDGLCLNRAYHCNGEKIFSTVGLTSWNKGIPQSEEVRKKISIALKGRGPNKGIHLSEETKQKLSTSLKGHRGSNKGIPRSEEVRKRISEAQKNRIKVSIEGMVFGSLNAAAKYYNVAVSMISYWVKTKKHNAVYIEK